MIKELLNAVLPENGLLCIAGFMYDKSAPPIQRFFDIDGVFEEAIAAGQEINGTGREVYFGCASYQDSDDIKRNVRNIHSIKCFFTEIDCGKGEGIGYPTKKKAFLATKKFCEATGLPLPWITDSGNGLQLFWCLNEELDYNTWKPIANAFKAKIIEQDFRADNVVTADGARVLRLPGTLNKKDPNEHKATQILHHATPISLVTFTACINYMPKANTGSNTKDSVMDALLNSSRKWSFEKIYRKSIKRVEVIETAPEEYEEHDGIVAIRHVEKKVSRSAGCPQIEYCVANSATLPEGLWRAALSVANCCVDRVEGITMVSRGYAKDGEYTTQDEWFRKAENNTNGAVSCEYFRTLSHPHLCTTCIHRGKIKNPLALGAFIEEATPEDNIITDRHDNIGEEVTMEIPHDYPFPWMRPKHGGVAKRDQSGGDDDEPEEMLVYEHDLWVTRHMESEGQTLVQIALRLPHRGIIEFTAPMAALLKQDKCQEILNAKGVALVEQRIKLMRQYIAAWIDKLQKQGAAEMAREQFGWCEKDTKFVIGNREIDSHGEVHYSPIIKSIENVAEIYSKKGSFEEWQRVANAYARPGCEARAFALFCSFGAPFYNFIGEGSMIVHFTNVASGVGKSTAQRVATSVWGDPQKGMLTNDDTINAKLHRVGVLRNMPAVIDEITNMDPAAVSSFAFQIYSGRGKNRMKSHDNEERLNHSTWSTIAITSGNNSLYDVLRQHKAISEGEMYRILEVPMPENTSIKKKEADLLYSRILPENYGHAGEMMMKFVVANKGTCIDHLHKLHEALDARIAHFMGISEEDLPSKIRLYSACLACAFTGGALANKLGIIDIPMGPVMDWAASLVATTKVAIEKSSPLTDGAGSGAIVNKYWNEIIGQVLVTNGGMTVVDEVLLNKQELKPVIGSLRGRYDIAEQKLYLSSLDFNNWMAVQRIPTIQVLARLRREGVLLDEDMFNLGDGTTKYSTAPVRAFVFDVDKLRATVGGSDEE